MTLGLVAAFLVLRLILAAIVPLSIDEAYAVVVSRSHSLSYFDHPPLGFALARFMADISGSETPFIVRLPYVLLGSASALLLFDLTRIAYGSVAGFWAAAAYSVAPFFFISAGLFVVPDGPLNFFLLASARLVMPLLIGSESNFALLRWIASGLMLGLALMSKYQAGLFALSAVLILGLTKAGRAQLRQPGPYAAVAVAALGLAPALIWNQHHGWASFVFQGNRGLNTEGQWLYPGNLAVTLLGQAAYLWPPTWAIAMLVLWRAVRTVVMPVDRTFLFIAALPIAFFDLIALISPRSLPHWSMSGFLFAFPLIGQWCVAYSRSNFKVLKASFVITALFVSLLSFEFALQARTGAFTRLFFERAPRFDVNWQIVDWSALDARLQSSRAAEPETYIVAPNWMQAARAGYSAGPNVPVEVLAGDRRHFQFTEPALKPGQPGYLVAALRPGDEAASEAAYRAGLGTQFVVAGPAEHTPQRIAGYHVFDLLVLPVVRSATAD